VSHRDVARIGNFFAKGIKFLAEGGRREQCIEMGFGGNGAVVSPWLVPFFGFFCCQFCERKKKMANTDSQCLLRKWIGKKVHLHQHSPQKPMKNLLWLLCH
jgi:hypothetical protein